MDRLTDKTAIIFGADAIGRGVALRFAREGARIAVLDASAEAAQALAADIPGAAAFPVRLHDEGSFRAAFAAVAQRLGPAEVLLNNPLPTPAVAPLDVQTGEAFAQALGAVRAAAVAMQAAFPFMREAGGGRIVTIGHRYGESVGEAIAPYNTAAWGLVGLTRTAALDWGRWQITANLLLPFAATPELEAAHLRRPRVIDMLTGQVPLRRAGDPIEDIGGAAAFLAGDEGAFLTGQVLHADGGQHVAGPVLNPARFAG